MGITLSVELSAQLCQRLGSFGAPRCGSLLATSSFSVFGEVRFGKGVGAVGIDSFGPSVELRSGSCAQFFQMAG